MATRIQLRRADAAEWLDAEPTLAEGEIGIELDTKKIKIGDGELPWSALGYFYSGIDDLIYVDGVTSSIQTQLDSKAPNLSPTITTPTINGGVIDFANIIAPLETYKIIASAPTSTSHIDLDDSSVNYYTSNASANFTLNIRKNSSGTQTLDSFMAIGDTISVALIFVNGTTAYKPTVINIDGTAVGVTFRWGNGVSYPTPNTSSTSILTLTIVKTGSGTFTVFGAQSRYA
jgi:hypothetical protein